jgi:hypothetical protein
MRLIDGGPVPSLPDFIELSADEKLVLFDRHRPPVASPRARGYRWRKNVKAALAA